MSDRSIAQMRNLGPRMQVMLAEVDIRSESDLREIGSLEAFRRLKFRFGSSISLVALYAMEAALVDRDWRELSPQSRDALKKAACS